MRRKSLRFLAVILAFVLTVSFPATAFAATGKIAKTVSGTKVTLTLPTEKGVIGDNDIKITLVTKATKKVVTGSKVSVEVQMDSEAMGSMNMNETKTVTLKEGKTKGEYTGTVNFTDKGDWNLKVSFTTGIGKKAKTNSTTFLVTAK
jgi:hypothetical protein